MAVTNRIEPIHLIGELGGFLQGLGLGSPASPFFLLSLPTTPVVAGALYAQGGGEGPAEVLSRLRVQILVRDLEITSAMARAQTVWNALAKRKPDLPTIAAYLTPDHSVGPWYRDENNRPTFSLNFTATGTIRVV